MKDLKKRKRVISINTFIDAFFAVSTKPRFQKTKRLVCLLFFKTLDTFLLKKLVYSNLKFSKKKTPPISSFFPISELFFFLKLKVQKNVLVCLSMSMKTKSPIAILKEVAWRFSRINTKTFLVQEYLNILTFSFSFLFLLFCSWLVLQELKSLKFHQYHWKKNNWQKILL